MLINLIPLVVYRFYCMALYHSQMGRHVISDLIPINFFCIIKNMDGQVKYSGVLASL